MTWNKKMKSLKKNKGAKEELKNTKNVDLFKYDWVRDIYLNRYVNENLETRGRKLLILIS